MRAARTSERESTLETNGLPRVQRKVSEISRDIVWIEEILETPWTAGGLFTTGPMWIVEFIRLLEGRICFVRDGQEIQPSADYFGVFYAPYAIVDFRFSATRFVWVGLGSSGPVLFDWMKCPMIFEWGSCDLPESADHTQLLLAQPRPYIPIEVTSNPSPISSKARRMIASAYRDSTSIANLAESLGVSHAHLSRQFKRDFGMSPGDYRRHLRVVDASHRLQQGEAIIDVSHEVGFNDLARFYHAFRSVWGTSPGKCKNR